MTLRLNLVILAWDGVSGSTSYDILLDGTKVSHGGPRARTTKIAIPAGAEHLVQIRAQPSGQIQGAKFEWSSVSVTPPPPPVSSYPASYFTGPLGANNILPSKPGAFLGVWGPSNPGGGATWDQCKALILGREAAMGRTYDIILTVDLPDYLWPEQRLQWINAHGSIPVAHLGSGMTISGINAGSHDAELRTYADHWKAMGFKVMIRLFHEFCQPGTTYSIQSTNPTAWKQAWVRIVELFQTRGATNVGFWWCPTEGSERTLVDACYPGDQYVDWVGTDSYNFALASETGSYATPWHGGWAQFSELFDYAPPPWSPVYSRHSTYGPRKPFIIGETGSTYDYEVPLAKGDWYRNVPAAARNMEHLYGVCWFDVDASAETSQNPYSQRNNWLVDRLASYPSIFQGFVQMAQDPWFNTRS